MNKIIKIFEERSEILRQAVDNLIIKKHEIDHQILRIQGALSEIESLKQQVKQQKKPK